MGTLDEERLKAREIQAKKLMQLASLYEESLEPKIVILYRQLEALIAKSGMPLTHISLVLEMLKKECTELAYKAYVVKGSEKLKVLEKNNG